MLGIIIAGLIAAFWIGFILAAIVANEKREEELLEMAKKLEEIRRRYDPDPEENKEWITWRE